jgi:hypothetical protein
MENEKRIYVVVAATIQVPLYPNTDRVGTRTVVQPAGRQIAQACHATNILRLMLTERVSLKQAFADTTTIILQARDSAEMLHVYELLDNKFKPVLFGDENPEYGPGRHVTSLAVLATKTQVCGILDYLPLWGSNA